MTSPHASRLAALRQAMQQHGIAACLVPSADPHLSEYLPEHWQARAWISGFTGSAGTLLVTAEHAGLWTDGRYFEQAEHELAGSGIVLMKLKVPHTPEYLAWLAGQLKPGQQVAVAGDSVSVAGRRQLEKTLQPIGAALRTDLDLPGLVWTDRPPLPAAPVYGHAIDFACRPRGEKLAGVRAALREQGASHHLISSLDDIAWLTNLRGSDVECNPVFLAHLLIATDGGATLLVDRRKLDAALQAELAADGIALADYAALASTLAALPRGARLLLDPARVVEAVAALLPQDVALVEGASPSTLAKACKSPAELTHIHQTMRLDGAALVQAFRQLEQRLHAGERLTELDVEHLLLQARRRQPGFVGESFATIAGYQANGALPHYRATAAAHSQLHPEGLLLIDSGGQYLGGTTDITRVLALGPVTAEQRHDATLVMKGLIALSRARFPAGSSGQQLDALARAPLWSASLDYGHGTGHGVGYFLNVHEGPQSIRPPASGAQLTPLAIGMVNSIEPGLYRSGRYGIRHENLVAVVEAPASEFGSFLAFDTLTLCPFDRRVLAIDLLDASERAWLDDYHARVQAELAPLLQGEDLAWLQRHCAPLA